MLKVLFRECIWRNATWNLLVLYSW